MIPVRNVYHMLAYAFQTLNGSAYASCLEEEFENTADLLTKILVLGVRDQLRRGLQTTYGEKVEKLSTIRGRINIAQTMSQCTGISEVVCEHDEMTRDSYFNRIIKTTLILLLKCDIAADRRGQAISTLGILRDVGTLDPNHIDWNLRLNRNNASYVTLLSICRFAIEGLMLSKTEGENKIRNYVDDQRMSALYEKFILGYFRREHPKLNAASRFIDWDLRGGSTEFLPAMHSDVMLTCSDRTFIIDAKYYSTNLNEHFGRNTVSSANIYQIYTYVKNKASESGNVSGILLYAGTDAEIQPFGDYDMGGNKIHVRTLDMDQEFAMIAAQLDDIAEMVY